MYRPRFHVSCWLFSDLGFPGSLKFQTPSFCYNNFFFKADICHAYHTLIDHGVLPENIITLAYDDIAHNVE